MNKEQEGRISPYEFAGGELKEEFAKEGRVLSQPEMKKLFSSNFYGRTEYALLESVYRYPYLTKKNMESFADARLKDRKYNGYDNVIRQLWQDGALRRFEYMDSRFYRLSDCARLYMREKLDEKNLHSITVAAETDLAAVLETASLGQWHLSVIRGGGIKKNHFQETVRIRKEDLFLPSYLEVEHGKVLYRVASFPLAKRGDHMETFLEQVSCVCDALRVRKLSVRKEVFLIVIVCTHTEEMIRASRILSSLAATKNLTFYFASDVNTLFTKGLDLLYRVENNRGEEILKTVSVHQE